MSTFFFPAPLIKGEASGCFASGGFAFWENADFGLPLGS